MTAEVLVSIITGGRPDLAARPTRQFVESMRAAGFTDFEWVIREDHAEQYERDEHPLNIYSVDWASEYARTHWRHPTAVWRHGGFFGAFPGREWAMRSAEERGYQAVLQMDDNVIQIGLLTATQPAYRSAMDPGTCLRHLTDIALSTNSWMTGAQLNSIVPKGLTQITRAGYPYSVFVERTGPGRLPYYGPFEDDIMHALEYARHGGPHRTASVVDVIRYCKEHKAQHQGMRAHYDATRGLEIANRYPQNARIGIGPRSSGGKESLRGVRHFLSTTAFTPVAVVDADRFLPADQALREGVGRAVQAKREWDRGKISRRAGQ